MGCLECARFDNDTKKLMRELFSTEECILLALNIGSYLATMSWELRKFKIADLKRLSVQRQMDMTGMTLGKFMVALERKQRSMVVSQIEKQFKITLNVNHGVCPHGHLKVDEDENEREEQEKPIIARAQEINGGSNGEIEPRLRTERWTENEDQCARGEDQRTGEANRDAEQRNEESGGSTTGQGRADQVDV
jgi:hypothetical protein